MKILRDEAWEWPLWKSTQEKPSVLVVKNLLANTGDVRHSGSIPGSRRSLGGGRGNPLQYSCLENPHGQRSPVGYSLWGLKESGMTEWLSTAQSWDVFQLPTPGSSLLGAAVTGPHVVSSSPKNSVGVKMTFSNTMRVILTSFNLQFPLIPQILLFLFL